LGEAGPGHSAPNAKDWMRKGHTGPAPSNKDWKPISGTGQAMRHAFWQNTGGEAARDLDAAASWLMHKAIQRL